VKVALGSITYTSNNAMKFARMEPQLQKTHVLAALQAVKHAILMLLNAWNA